MAAITIQFDQAGIPAGGPGLSRSDGLIGTAVFPTDPANGAGTYLWVLLARPVGSGTTMSGAATATPSFTPDMSGTYLVGLTFNGSDTSGTTDVIGQFISTQGRFGIREPNGTLIPAAGETSQANSETGLAEGWHPERASALVAVDSMRGALNATHGSVLFVGASGGYASLTPGGPNQVLVTPGPGSDPVWSSLSSVAAPPGSGTLGAVTLTDAYSAGPTLVTTTPLGSVNLQRGSAADTDDVLAVLNGVGSVVSTIDGQGYHFSSIYYVDAAKTAGMAKGAGNRVNIFASSLSRFSVIPGQVQVLDAGSEAVPVLILDGDLDTGTWAPALDTYAVSTGGIEAMRLTSTQDMIVAGDITSGGQVFAPEGVGSDPGFSFTGSTGYGLARSGTATFMVASGQLIVGVAAAGVTISKNTTIAGSINASVTDMWNIGSTGTHYASVNSKHFTLREQASSPGTTTAVGYLWVKDDAPNTLWFTDDLGGEFQLGPGGHPDPHVLGTGSAVAPTYGFSTAPGLGVYKGAGNTLSFAISSAERVKITSGQMIVNNTGSEAFPALCVGAETDTGIWEPAANAMAFSTNSIEALRIDSSQNIITSAVIYAPNGTGLLPSYSFALDPDSGVLLGALGRVVITASGSSSAHFLPNQLRVSGASGTAVALQLAGQGDSDSGFFWTNGNHVGVVTGGVERQHWSANTTGLPASTITVLVVDGVEPSTDLDVVGLALTNTTAATDIQDQNSPALLWRGESKPSEGVTSTTQWSAQLVATSQGSAWGSDWVLSSLDDGGWSTMLTFESAGDAYFEASLIPGAKGTTPLGSSYDLGSVAIPWRHLHLEEDLTHNAGGRLGFYGSTPVVQSATYTRNATVVESRTLLASASATVTNNNNVLSALVADLKSMGLIG